MQFSKMVKVNDFFKFLLSDFNFQINKEECKNDDYSIEYSSTSFVIKIEKYFKEFYVTLYKPNSSNSEINLFNLLQFLRRGELLIPASDYFKNEKNIDQCYQKQLAYLSKIIYKNYDQINDFFDEKKYQENIIELEDFWRSKHPELY